MIQIVKEIYIKIADQASAEWSALPIVPASANIETEISHEASGLLQTSKLKATLSRKHPWLLRNLLVSVLLDDDTTISLGSSDLPVRFTFERAASIEVSFEYKTRAGM